MLVVQGLRFSSGLPMPIAARVNAMRMFLESILIVVYFGGVKIEALFCGWFAKRLMGEVCC